MKIFIICFLTLFLSAGALAQNVWLGLGTGLNSYHGLLGANLEVGVADPVAFRVSAGLGTWGTKAGGGLIFRKGVEGWGFGIGYLHCSGVKEAKATMPTTSGSQEVTMDFLPLGTVNLSAIKSWKVGQGGGRFCLEVGYAIQTGPSTFYKIKSGATLNDQGTKVMDVLRPGGLSFGVAYLFAIGKSGQQ